MMTQARKGVNQGFKEAEDILKNLNALTDDVQATIDDTHGLVMDGLDDRTKLLNGLADTYAIDTTQRASQVDRYSSVAYAEAKSYEMQIETADGDLVTLSIARESAYAQTNRSQQQNGESLFISESARFDSMQVAYSISGDIDDGEREAIMDLVHQVDAVANEFFGGDMQAAMQSASGIQFDTSELDAYAFSLKHSESLTTKQSYQAVQEYSEQPPTEAPSSARADAKSAILGAAESFMEKMLELMDKAREESRIQDAPMVATNLLKEAIKADPRLPENIQQAPADQAVDKLVDQLSDNL